LVVSLACGLGIGPFPPRSSAVERRPLRLLCDGELRRSWSAIINSIGGELVDLIVDLIKQRHQLRGIAGLLIWQTMSNNLATAGINSQVLPALPKGSYCHGGKGPPHTPPSSSL